MSEVFKINMNTVEVKTRQVYEDKALISQFRNIERTPQGAVVKDSGWENGGVILVCEQEVSDSTWWNPSTWGMKKTIRVDLPGCILQAALRT